MPILLASLGILAFGAIDIRAVAFAPVAAAVENIPAAWLPGRAADARVATVASRIAVAGVARCSTLSPSTGVVLEHLSQFDLADRAQLAATQALDRGPEAVAVVRGSPADAAGIVPGDVVLAIDGVVLPSDEKAAMPFDAAVARRRTDRLTDLLAGAPGRPSAITLLRGGGEVIVHLTSRPVCPSRIHLARSSQLNAYADGDHVFLTTALVARLVRDDELAFVIAHEMAHNILGHAALMHAGAPVRPVERDADRLAGELMLDAGYDPVTGAEALHRLGSLDLGIRLFASHDSTADRIAAMRRLAAARVVP